MVPWLPVPGLAVLAGAPTPRPSSSAGRSSPGWPGLLLQRSPVRNIDSNRCFLGLKVKPPLSAGLMSPVQRGPRTSQVFGPTGWAKVNQVEAETESPAGSGPRRAGVMRGGSTQRFQNASELSEESEKVGVRAPSCRAWACPDLRAASSAPPAACSGTSPWPYSGDAAWTAWPRPRPSLPEAQGTQSGVVAGLRRVRAGAWTRGQSVGWDDAPVGVNALWS